MGARVGEQLLDLVGAVATALEGRRDLFRLSVYLLEPGGVHGVLELGVRQGLLDLHVVERARIGNRALLPHVPRERPQLLIQVDAPGMEIVARRLRLLNVRAGDLGGGARVVQSGSQVVELLDDAAALMLRPRQRSPHLGEARDHVAPLLLEQAHIRADAADDILHMAALLAQVSDEQAFFLKHDLELLEFALLLGQPVPRELRARLGLLAADLEARTTPPGGASARRRRGSGSTRWRGP